MTAPKTITALPPDMPAHMKSLPRDSVGRPIPFFVAIVKGEPDFRVVTTERLVAAVRGQLCWVCGMRLKRVMGSASPRGTFVAGPMCVVNRTSAEPPCHADCAEWSAKACPFLTKPAKERRTANLPDGREDPAGIAIMRNPGVTALIDSSKWAAYPVQAEGAQPGILFNMTRADSVAWLHQGRKATTAQIMESIDTGLPSLIAVAEAEPGAMPVLARRLRDTMRFIPDPDPYDYDNVMAVLAELR